MTSYAILRGLVAVPAVALLHSISARLSIAETRIRAHLMCITKEQDDAFGS
jgi:ParB-like chromosome segregation protein Spo0J